MPGRLLNVATRVEAEKTVQELAQYLGKKGARAVTVQWDKDGLPSGVVFALEAPGGFLVDFRMPANVEGVHLALRKSTGTRGKDLAQARRVAWRILKDWCEAQIALVESNQVSMAQAFMPYAVESREGRSVYDLWLDSASRQRQLQAGGA